METLVASTGRGLVEVGPTTVLEVATGDWRLKEENQKTENISGSRNRDTNRGLTLVMSVPFSRRLNKAHRRRRPGDPTRKRPYARKPSLEMV